jgi:hypothetical protein
MHSWVLPRGMQVMLISRYMTTIFIVFCFLSYLVVYPFSIVFQLIMNAWNMPTPDQNGVMLQLMQDPTFWLVQASLPALSLTQSYVLSV